MTFVTYKATPGLERFPTAERFRVFRSTHKQLMAQDPEFRRRMNRFTGSMVIMAALYCSVIGVTCLLGAKGIWAPGTLVTFQTVLTVAYVAYTIRVSFAAQEFQNEGVGRVLSK